MEFEINILNKPLKVKLIRKRTTKHTYLRVKSNELVQISSNPYFTKRNALSLINEKITWIETCIKKLESNLLPENNFYYLGQIYQLNNKYKSIDEFYREKVEEILPPLVKKHAQIMNLYPTSIKYRKNKRTWGSCNYKNGLNFNTLLVKFPLEVVEYVVIHELAHIKEKNHSRKFWDLVEVYCKDYKRREKLLKSFL